MTMSAAILTSASKFEVVPMSQGSTFTAMLSEMLDVMRWPADPWNPGPAGKNVSSLPGSPSHRANHIATAALSSHPYRPLYLSGAVAR